MDNDNKELTSPEEIKTNEDEKKNYNPNGMILRILIGIGVVGSRFRAFRLVWVSA